jgi:Type II secretion system (T2SS), protein E, N-terminal domain
LPKTLAQIAVDAGLLSRADVIRARELATERGVPLAVVVVRELGVDEIALVAAFRRELRILAIDPSAVTPDVEAFRTVPPELCRKHRVAPLEIRGGPERDDKELWLAMADPTDHEAIAEVERITGAAVDVALLPLSAIDELIERGSKQLSTQVVKRDGFGRGIIATTQPHARVGLEDIVESTATMRVRELARDADVAIRLAALVKLLVGSGVIKDDEYEEAVRELVRARAE